MRYDIGRESNHNTMAVGLPLVSSVQHSRSAGIVATSTQYETLHINGVTGRVTRAHALTGMMTKSKSTSPWWSSGLERIALTLTLSLSQWLDQAAGESVRALYKGGHPRRSTTLDSMACTHIPP